MPTPSTTDLPRPKSWDEFEDIVWDLYSRQWPQSHVVRNGRAGQRQHGVDIYGQPTYLYGEYIGIQCKRYADGKITRRKLEAEITEAEKFHPLLSEYVIATIASSVDN